LLGKFPISQWFNYKSKPAKNRKIADMFARTNAARMINLVGEIETAAGGGTDKCGRTVRHDWRAAQMLAGLHDDRFRNAPSQTTTTTHNTQVLIGVGGEAALLKLVDIYARQALPPAETAKLPANSDSTQVIDIQSKAD
jgi:hypothetical protein